MIIKLLELDVPQKYTSRIYPTKIIKDSLETRIEGGYLYIKFGSDNNYDGSLNFNDVIGIVNDIHIKNGYVVGTLGFTKHFDIELNEGYSFRIIATGNIEILNGVERVIDWKPLYIEMYKI